MASLSASVPSSRRLATTIAVLAGGLVAAAIVVAALAHTAGQPPLLGHEEASLGTEVIAAALGLIAQVAALICLGGLLAVAVFTRSSDHGRLPESVQPLLIGVRHAATIWFSSALLLIPFNAADAQGVPVSYVLTPSSLIDFLEGTQTALAWLITCVIALIIVAITAVVRNWRVVAVTTALAIVAALPTVVTAQVSVGRNHDWATDGATIFTVATTIWFGATWAISSMHNQGLLPFGAANTAVAARRYQHIAGIALAIALPARLGIGAYELAGQSPAASGYGVFLLLLGAVLVILGLRWLYRTIRARSAADDDQATRLRLAGSSIDVFLVLIMIGIQVALIHLVPPRFTTPQTFQENYLGFNLPNPPQWSTLLLPGRVNVLLTSITLTAVALYLWGVIRLRLRGDQWPAGRTVAWLCGWLIIAMVATTRLWEYSSATFSLHMLVHMTLNMLAPVLLVMGGPITLLLRAGRTAAGHGLPTFRDIVTELMSWRLVQRLTNPLLIWVIFIGSFYVLYFSSLFGTAMKYHWAHQLMMVHFIVIGCLFYWLSVGVDRPPRPLPHIARLGFVLAAMPFHAFFAIGVLSESSIIGGNFYQSLGITWNTNLMADQQTGGQITWATGELPMLIVIVALLAQWFRQDQREARRRDRREDAGMDDSLDAYNDMLAQLAQRDEQRTLDR